MPPPADARKTVPAPVVRDRVVDAFTGPLGNDRGTRALAARADERIYGRNHRAVRALLDRAERKDIRSDASTPDAQNPGARVQAMNLAWPAGFSTSYPSLLRAAAKDVTPERGYFREILYDALVATALSHLLPMDLYASLMRGWWLANDDPQGAESTPTE